MKSGVAEKLHTPLSTLHSANGAYSQNNTDSIDVERVTEDFTPSQPSENCVKQQNKPSDGKKKRIKRVIVFYNDGSFEELFPHIR